ncbi:Prolyl 4-hydroxylase alpha-like protein [Quillaja saponaria]|uniref:Prolyl 4-hydroxylase alpha-like protein n=1 Tax=Quillaja saponaria TaxID=32244 RepID=A0AAD7M068_QUISA|nr:Prolyl 4-hydroxylase alpha-like protein [Quillaja saponaria]
MGVRATSYDPALCNFFLSWSFRLYASLSGLKDLGVVRSSSRLLDESADKEYEALPNGESGEAFVGSIPLQVLSWRPRALYFPNFASPELCRRIIKMEKSKLKPSELALRKWETAESTKGIRTSFGTFLTSSEDKTGTLELIERKIARATMIPKNHGEAFNILRYEEGQKYDSHYDALSSSLYGPQQSHRIATFLVYLSNVEEGGETMFPFEVMITKSALG